MTLAAVLLAGRALAHDADVIFVTLDAADGGRLVERVTLTAGTLGQLAPVDANADQVLDQADLDGSAAALLAGVWDDMPLATAAGARCRRSAERATLREGYVELEALFDCGPGELRQDFRLLRVLPANYRVALGLKVEGDQPRYAQGSLTSLTIAQPGATPLVSFDQFAVGFNAGVPRAIVLDVLACLLALGFAARTWRSGLLALGPAGAAVMVGSVVGLHPVFTTAGLVFVAVALARADDLNWVWGLVVGLCVGARDGGGTLGFALGLGWGTTLIVLPSGISAIAIGQILNRRQRLLSAARWAAAAAVAFGAGFRLMG